MLDASAKPKSKQTEDQSAQAYRQALWRRGHGALAAARVRVGLGREDDDDVLIDDDGLRPMTMEEDDDYSIDDQDHQQKPSTRSHTSAERHPTPPTNPYPSSYYSPFVHQKDDEDLNDLNISVMAQS